MIAMVPLQNEFYPMNIYFAALLVIFSNITIAEPFAYVTHYADSYVSIIDLANNADITKVSVRSGSEYIVLNSSSTRAYISNTLDNTVSVIDTDAHGVINTIMVGKAPQALAITPSGNKVYVANTHNDSISVIDTTKNIVTDTLMVKNPSALAVNLEGTHIYVASGHLNTVSVFDIVTDQIINTIDVGNNPQDIAFKPMDPKVYVANHDSHTISIIDTANYKVIDTISLDTAPLAIAVHPNGKSIYVTTRDAFVVIDPASNQIVDEFLNSDKAFPLTRLAINSSGTEAYLTNPDTHQIVVFDLVNMTFKRFIDTGSQPWNISLTPDHPKIPKKIADESIVCLFNWAEDNFPYYFSAPIRSGYSTQYPYSFRYYVHTNFYLGVSATDEHVYYLPSGGNRKPIDAGLFSYWQEQAGCGAGLPTITFFTATPNPVDYNGSITLQWSSSNTIACTSNAWGTDIKAGTGSFGLTNLISNQTYSLTCSGAAGSTSRSVAVQVNPQGQVTQPVVTPAPTIASFTATPNTVDYKGSTTLQWSSSNATGCSSNAWSGSLAAAGNHVVSDLTSSKTYNLTCTGLGGTANSSVNVTVKPQVVATPAPAITSFVATPSSLDFNGSTTLQWSSSNATGCTSNAWTGSLSASGSKIISGLTGNQTYNLTCTGLGGSANSSVNITVKPRTYSIGSKGPAEGIVFYVDATGQHGLEAQPADYNVDGNASCLECKYPDGSLLHYYTWDEALIVAQSYGPGWHLPTKDELNLLYNQQSVVGGFDSLDFYWSSTEYDANYAWDQSFMDGYQGYWTKSDLDLVRAVRAF